MIDIKKAENKLKILSNEMITGNELNECIEFFKRFVDLVRDFKSQSIHWSVKDFESQAIVNEGKNWKKVYNPKAFNHALEMMIHDHNRSVGINYGIVNNYLEDYCKIR